MFNFDRLDLKKKRICRTGRRRPSSLEHTICQDKLRNWRRLSIWWHRPRNLRNLQEHFAKCFLFLKFRNLLKSMQKQKSHHNMLQGGTFCIATSKHWRWQDVGLCQGIFLFADCPEGRLGPWFDGHHGVQSVGACIGWSSERRIGIAFILKAIPLACRCSPSHSCGHASCCDCRGHALCEDVLPSGTCCPSPARPRACCLRPKACCLSPIRPRACHSPARPRACCHSPDRPSAGSNSAWNWSGSGWCEQLNSSCGARQTHEEDGCCWWRLSQRQQALEWKSTGALASGKRNQT